MKVLLFVQTGDARPKCAKSFGDRKRNALAYFDAIAKRFGSEGQPERAWLVECENAHHGRLVIQRGGAAAWHVHADPSGRILASGGDAMTAPRGPQRSEDRSDLTPAEARAEVEAFMGEGWRGTAWKEGDAHFVGAYPMYAAQWTLRSRESLTYRAAVDALKQAWRDAVRPWCVAAASEWDDCYSDETNLRRILKEDSNG